MTTERDSWTATPFVPRTRSLLVLERAAHRCTGCPLYEDTTQVVFGEGRRGASIVLVGEQPGDAEDRHGHPFVGPAGRVLWSCVDLAGIDRADVYATNAVKHFKHERRGKRRLHKRPDVAEIEACHPWLDAELRVVGALVIVALGATAARSLFGRSMPIAASRGATYDVDAIPAIVTYHPSAALRDRDAAAAIREALVDDLHRASRVAREDR